MEFELIAFEILVHPSPIAGFHCGLLLPACRFQFVGFHCSLQVKACGLWLNAMEKEAIAGNEAQHNYNSL